MGDFESKLRDLIKSTVREEVRIALEEATRLDELLTPFTAARAAGVSPDTIRRWVRKGNLIGHRKGRTLRVSRLELETLLKGTRARNDGALTPEQLADRMFG
jgi:excisionase family DNA binding protein